MKNRFGLLGFLLAAALVACPQPQEVTPPTPQTPTPAPTVFKPKLLGSVTFDIDSSGKTTKARFERQTRATTFPAESEFTFTPAFFEALTPAAGTDRFLNARFNLANVSVATDYSNLTFVAYFKRRPAGTDNVNGSAFSNIIDFGGGSSNAATWALQLRPSHGMKSDSLGGYIVDDTHSDMQVFSPSETTTLETDAQAGGLINSGTVGEGVLSYGYVARNAANGRTITHGTNNNTLSISLRVPQNGDAGNGNSAYRYSMTFLIFADNTTRVTESVEEQAASGAGGRATPLGATVAYLCGSSLSSGTFIPGAKTAGVATPTAYIGGNFKITSTAAFGYTAIGNTPTNVTTPAGTISAVNGVLSHYAPLTATNTLVASNGGAAGTGGAATVANDGSLDITPAVGARGAKTITYRVGDGTCTSPDQTADVTINNMVWYTKNNVAGAGTGTYGDPIKSLATASTASSAGDYIYVAKGDGATTNQNAGITLKASQKLIGEGAALSIGATSIIAAGATRAEIGNSGGTGLVLSTNNDVHGLNITGTTAGVTGLSFNTLNMDKASVTASAGPALDLSIGALTVSLDSINSSGGTNSLKLTSNTGTFVVNGDGVTAGSGGTLQGSSADGVLLSNPGDVSLKFVNITNAGTHGITLASTTGTQKLTLQNTAVQGAGVAVGTLGDGLNFSGTGSSNTTIAVNASSFKTNEQNGMFLITPLGSSATLALSVLGGTVFQNNAAAGLSVPLFGSGNATVDVQNNTFGPDTVGSGNAINVSAESTVATQLVQARIINNTINMFSGGAGNGLEIAARNVGTMKVDATGNTISNFSTIGIRMLALGTNTQIDATVKNNSVTAPTTTATIIPLEGILFASGPTGSSVTTSRMCLNISNNNSTGGTSVPSAGYRVRQRVGATFQLQGYFGLPNSPAAVGSFITTIQSNVGTVLVQPVVTNFQVNYTSATCATPSF